MALMFVIHPEMITGEAIRYHLNQKKASARDLAKHLGIHEGNVSYMLSRGQGLPKHRAKVLEFVGLNEHSLKREEKRILEVLSKNKVQLVGNWKHSNPLWVTLPYGAIQRLIGE